jgi:hypothetical protein
LRSPYRCSLPGLTRFGGHRRAGPGLLASHDEHRHHIHGGTRRPCPRLSAHTPTLRGSSPALSGSSRMPTLSCARPTSLDCQWRRGRDGRSTALPQPPHHTAPTLATAAPVVPTPARVSPPTRTAASPNPLHRTPPTHPPFAGPHPPSPARRARRPSHVHVPHRSTANGGEGGIRTRGTVTRTHAFQACSFGHSDTSPRGS